MDPEKEFSLGEVSTFLVGWLVGYGYFLNNNISHRNNQQDNDYQGNVVVQRDFKQRPTTIVRFGVRALLGEAGRQVLVHPGEGAAPATPPKLPSTSVKSRLCSSKTLRLKRNLFEGRRQKANSCLELQNHKPFYSTIMKSRSRVYQMKRWGG